MDILISTLMQRVPENSRGDQNGKKRVQGGI